MRYVLKQIDSLGRSVTSNLEYTAQVLMMVYLSFRAAIYDQAQGLRTVISVISMQIYFTGWQALPLITVLALASGGLVILQSSANFSIFGGTEMIGKFLIALIVRELSPVVVALVVIARSGTAVASEIGNMRANREIEALESLGINPYSFIVFPRILGGLISVLCLGFYFNFVALMGGFFITKVLNDMSFTFFFDSLVRAVAIEDAFMFLFKNSFSGVIIFVVSCYQGLLVKRSPTEVPIVTTQAVVNSIIYVTVFNLTVSGIFYVNQLMKMGVL